MNLFKELQLIAQKYPDHTAIVDDKVSLSYSDLVVAINEKSIQLENALKIQSENTLVAIILEKSAGYIIAQLACNKLGLAFLPLVKNQFERNQKILSAAKPHILISDNEIELEMRTWASLSYSRNESDESWNIYSSDNYLAYPEVCAYVIFTSGTTGTPKGILLNDKAVVEVVKEQAQVFEINDKSRFAWLLSPGFDASLSDIYATLLSGATLYIPTFSMDKIKTMGEYFTRYEITHSDISPSVLPLMKNRFHYFKTLKAIIFGGEVGNVEVIKELSQTVKMINAYGPTETTICSSLSVVDDTWTPDNIGLPLKGVKYRIDANHPEGELLIGGSHLALGYLNDNIHNERFFEEHSERWYKTGDITEFKNNSWYFKGRVDRQFKYHGQLICPEEIETAATHSASSAACYFDGEKIHLFYTGNLDEQLMMKQLASYMKPHFTYRVEALPLNSNGKIDTKQLAGLIQHPI